MRGVRGSRPFVIAKSAASRRPREKFRESRRCHQSAQREQSPARLGYDARCEIESAPTSARPPVAVPASALLASAQAAEEVKTESSAPPSMASLQSVRVQERQRKIRSEEQTSELQS